MCAVCPELENRKRRSLKGLSRPVCHQLCTADPQLVSNLYLPSPDKPLKVSIERSFDLDPESFQMKSQTARQ